MYGITDKTQDVSGSNRMGPGTHLCKLKEITFGPVTDTNPTQVITFTFIKKDGNIHKDTRWPFDRENALKYKKDEPSKYSDAELGIKKGEVMTDDQFCNAALKRVASEFKHIMTKFLDDPNENVVLQVNEKDPEKAWAQFCGLIKKKIEKQNSWNERKVWLVVILKETKGAYYDRTRVILPFLKIYEQGDTPETVAKYFDFKPKYDLFVAPVKSGENSNWTNSAPKEEDPNEKAEKARSEDTGSEWSEDLDW